MGILICCLQIAKYLLEHNADINIADVRGATPLHRAASKGNLSTLKLLLQYLPNLTVDCKDYYGNTPLHLACEEERTEEAKLLVQHGADLNNRNRASQTPLDLCSLGLAKTLINLDSS